MLPLTQTGRQNNCEWKDHLFREDSQHPLPNRGHRALVLYLACTLSPLTEPNKWSKESRAQLTFKIFTDLTFVFIALGLSCSLPLSLRKSIRG